MSHRWVKTQRVVSKRQCIASCLPPPTLFLLLLSSAIFLTCCSMSMNFWSNISTDSKIQSVSVVDRISLESLPKTLWRHDQKTHRGIMTSSETSKKEPEENPGRDSNRFFSLLFWALRLLKRSFSREKILSFESTSWKVKHRRRTLGVKTSTRRPGFLLRRNFARSYSYRPVLRAR